MIKNISLILCLLWAMLGAAQTQVYSFDIEGYWKTEDGRGKFYIYKKGTTWEGKLVYQYLESERSWKDKNNPNPALRSRPLLNIVYITNLTFDYGDEEWIDGKIYNPEDGKTYGCKVYFKNGDKTKLHFRGYLGFSLLGQTQVWTKLPN